MEKIGIKFKKITVIIFESFSSTVSMWAGLLAVFAALTLTGLIDVHVKPKVSILQPTYIIRKPDFHDRLLQNKYPLADSLTDVIFRQKSTIVADIPYPNIIYIKSGDIIADIYQNSEGRKFTYKALTDGNAIYRSQKFGYSPHHELIGENELDDSGINLSSQQDLQPDDKRIQVMPYFVKYIVDQFGYDWQFLSTDSILKINDKFCSYNTEPPPLLNSVLIDCRKVFSIISIENNSAFDIRGLKLLIYKRYTFSMDDNLKLEAWTIGNSILDCSQLADNVLSLSIRNLQAYSDIQLIISGWCLQIKDEDIVLTYEKFKSLNENFIWFVVVSTFILSASCSFIVRVWRVKNLN